MFGWVKLFDLNLSKIIFVFFADQIGTFGGESMQSDAKTNFRITTSIGHCIFGKFPGGGKGQFRFDKNGNWHPTRLDAFKFDDKFSSISFILGEINEFPFGPSIHLILDNFELKNIPILYKFIYYNLINVQIE